MLEKIGKYEIRLPLGRGGMGVVYEGFDPTIGRRVAIKTLRTESIDPDDVPEFLARFKREAQSAGRLSHPHIVTIYEYGEQDGMPFIVMEYVAGRDLSVDLKRGVRFGVDEVVRLMTQLLGALGHAHEHGVVHRDIKPQNILLLEDGSLKVVDFGIARLEDGDSFTKTGLAIGTPAYMAPEQVMGQKVTARSDIFSCGTLLYQLLTGDRPFTGDEYSVKQKILKLEPIRPSELNPLLLPPWDAVVARAMAKKPEARYDNARQFLESIRAAQEAEKRDTEEVRRKRIEAEEHARRSAEARTAEEVRKREEGAQREIVRREREEAEARAQAEVKRRPEQDDVTRKQPGSPGSGAGRWVAAAVVVALAIGASLYLRQGTEEQADKANAARVLAETLAKEESAKREKAETLAREEAERWAKLEEEAKRQTENAEKARVQDEARKAAEEKAKALALKKEEDDKRNAELAAKKVAEAKARAEAEVKHHAELAARREVEEKAKAEEAAKAEAARKAAEVKLAQRKPGVVFRDCPDCPQMIVIPPGEFTMGSPTTELGRNPNEGPQKTVRIPRDFAIGRTEVTVANFRKFVRESGWSVSGGCLILDGEWRMDSGRSFDSPGFSQTDVHPATCVNWRDAVAYSEWLSKHTGRKYRLPTEAEWEYVARGGSRTARFWGDDPVPACSYANVGDRSLKQLLPRSDHHECDDAHLYTAPVGTLRPNSFGVYDMLGNVWEWVQDCWGRLASTPADGSAVLTGNCAGRVMRGGAWNSSPNDARSAQRAGLPITARYSHFGFRVARELE